MSFVIEEILASQGEQTEAVVRHQGSPVKVTVHGRQNEAVRVGESIRAEIGYDQVLAWKGIEDYDDAQSGIWQGGDGIHLSGRVQTVLDYGDGKIVMDIYVRNGPELFTVTSDAIPEEEAFGATPGVEIVVNRLYIYPT